MMKYLSCVMVLTEFIDWSPAHDLLDNSTDIRQVWFIIKVWRSVRADYTIEFFMSPGEHFGIRQNTDEHVVQLHTRRLAACFNHRTPIVRYENLEQTLC